MATFVLVHGGGSTSWDWHLVAPLLENSGHGVLAVDLPIDDEEASLSDYSAVVSASAGGADHVIVVGHSLGGFTAPLACEELQAEGLVYLAGMIPLPEESFSQWWTNTGHDRESIDENPDVAFFNGVPDHLAREARARTRDQQGGWMSLAWPAQSHPNVPTTAILCQDDQFFPAPFMRRHIIERLGIEPEEIPGGHYVTLSNPAGVATALDGFARKVSLGRACQ
jgi:pimeloyl-ACP methyl ester carboxylesterase